MRRSEKFVYVGLFVASFVLTGMALSGCANKEQKRDTLTTAKASVETAYLATKTVSDTFDEWSKQHQEELVAEAKTQKAAEEAVAEFRAKRQRVRQAIIVAYTSIAAAASSLVLFEADKLSTTELLLRLSEAVESVLSLKNAIRDLQGG
jgi:hypothetical protein